MSANCRERLDVDGIAGVTCAAARFGHVGANPRAAIIFGDLIGGAFEIG